MKKSIEQWNDKKAMSPFQDLTNFQDSFDRLFNEVNGLKQLANSKDFPFSPSCEISEEDNNLIFVVDVPGVSKDHVKVEVDGDRLTIRAERKEEKKREGKKKFVSEISYGSYTRTFRLPGPVDEKKVEAKFENGVLKVTLPKTEGISGKQIPIQ